MNASTFPEPYGWQNIVNESQFNPINASIVGWQSSAGEFAWLFASAFIILLIPAAIYIKSQNFIAAAFGQIMITLLMQHYEFSRSNNILANVYHGCNDDCFTNGI